MSVQLGDRVKDTITGFVGIAECKAEWLHGCVRVSVRPEKLSKEGKQQELVTFDEPQLVVVKAGAVPNSPFWRDPAAAAPPLALEPPRPGRRAAGPRPDLAPLPDPEPR